MIKRCVVLSCDSPANIQATINNGIYDNTSSKEKCISVQVVVIDYDDMYVNHFQIILTFDS